MNEPDEAGVDVDTDLFLDEDVALDEDPDGEDGREKCP